MNIIHFRWTGTTELMTHNNQAALPTNRYKKAMSKLTSKRKKTDIDYEDLSRLEWEAGLYLYNGELEIPDRCIKATILAAAKKTKCGVKWKEGAIIQENHPRLHVPGLELKITPSKDVPNPELNPFFEDYSIEELVKVQRNLVPRTRPIFPAGWYVEFSIMYEDDILDKDEIIEFNETAGRRIGLCEKRPELGRFNVEVI